MRAFTSILINRTESFVDFVQSVKMLYIRYWYKQRLETSHILLFVWYLMKHPLSCWAWRMFLGWTLPRPNSITNAASRRFGFMFFPSHIGLVSDDPSFFYSCITLMRFNADRLYYRSLPLPNLQFPSDMHNWEFLNVNKATKGFVWYSISVILPVATFSRSMSAISIWILNLFLKLSYWKKS